jgi:radical SAM peptide maturase (CXXX-repeat target family)
MVELREPRREERPKSWQEGRAKTVTFIVTEDCQLRCKYCYLAGKNKTSKMNFEIARATIDHLLRNREQFNEGSVIWDFIGGEPFLEIDLIDRISDYAKLRMYETDHPWFNNYRFSFSTNGLLYGKDKVQRYIAKNRSHISIGLSIDGTKRKHDSQRIFPNGRGSYDAVAKNIPLWLAQFPAASTRRRSPTTTSPSSRKAWRTYSRWASGSST